MVRTTANDRRLIMNAHETNEIRQLTVGEIEMVAGGGEYGPLANEPPKTGLTTIVSAVVETVVQTATAVVRAIPL
jgi:hypothetical protein